MTVLLYFSCLGVNKTLLSKTYKNDSKLLNFSVRSAICVLFVNVSLRTVMLLYNYKVVVIMYSILYCSHVCCNKITVKLVNSTSISKLYLFSSWA